MNEEYNEMELMTIVASRDIEDEKIIYVGTGIPMLVTSLAQKTRNLKITSIFEVGGIGPEMPTLPLSVACSRTTWRALRTADSSEAFEIAQQGYADYAFLGGAQIDKYGNLNSTVLGDYHAPKVRFPGSGGANAFASFAEKSKSSKILCQHIPALLPPGKANIPDGFSSINFSSNSDSAAEPTGS